MSAERFGGPVVVPAVAASLQDLLGARASPRKTFSLLTLRADTDNTSIVWHGMSDLTASSGQHGYLLAGEVMTAELQAAIRLDSVWVVGNGTDKIYVSGLEY